MGSKPVSADGTLGLLLKSHFILPFVFVNSRCPEGPLPLGPLFEASLPAVVKLLRACRARSCLLRELRQQRGVQRCWYLAGRLTVEAWKSSGLPACREVAKEQNQYEVAGRWSLKFIIKFELA